MTASQIIGEVEALTPEEQARVLRFAFQSEATRQRTVPELAALAQRLVDAADSAEAAALCAELERAFYSAKTAK